MMFGSLRMLDVQPKMSTPDFWGTRWVLYFPMVHTAQNKQPSHVQSGERASLIHESAQRTLSALGRPGFPQWLHLMMHLWFPVVFLEWLSCLAIQQPLWGPIRSRIPALAPGNETQVRWRSRTGLQGAGSRNEGETEVSRGLGFSVGIDGRVR